MTNLFDGVNADEDVFDKMENSKNRTFASEKKENYWEKENIEKLEIDVSKFNKTTKSFSIYCFPENNIPEESYKALLTLAVGLMSKGYTFRHTGDKDNVLHNKIISADGAKFESYLPWKKYNPKIADPILVTPEGYRVAIGIHRAFMKLPPAVRAIIGRDVNTLLGMAVVDPVDFVLSWTDGGDEVLTRDSDYKKIGNNSFILQVAEKANIPVVNVFNSNYIERFKELIK